MRIPLDILLALLLLALSACGGPSASSEPRPLPLIPAIQRTGAAEKHFLMVGGGCEEEHHGSNLFAEAFVSLGNSFRMKGWAVEALYAGAFDRAGERAGDTARIAAAFGHAPAALPNASSSHLFDRLDRAAALPPGSRLLLFFETHGGPSYELDPSHSLCLDHENLDVNDSRLLARLAILKARHIRLGVIDRSCFGGGSIEPLKPFACVLSEQSENRVSGTNSQIELAVSGNHPELKNLFDLHLFELANSDLALAPQSTISELSNRAAGAWVHWLGLPPVGYDRTEYWSRLHDSWRTPTTDPRPFLDEMRETLSRLPPETLARYQERVAGLRSTELSGPSTLSFPPSYSYLLSERERASEQDLSQIRRELLNRTFTLALDWKEIFSDEPLLLSGQPLANRLQRAFYRWQYPQLFTVTSLGNRVGIHGKALALGRELIDFGVADDHKLLRVHILSGGLLDQLRTFLAGNQNQLFREPPSLAKEDRILARLTQAFERGLRAAFPGGSYEELATQVLRYERLLYETETEAAPDTLDVIDLTRYLRIYQTLASESKPEAKACADFSLE